MPGGVGPFGGSGPGLQPFGAQKEWSDWSGAAAAILSAYKRSSVWKGDSKAQFDRAYWRARAVKDCLLFGFCTTVFIGVAEAGAEIFRAPKKTAIFVIAIHSALLVEIDGEAIQVQPGIAKIVDSSKCSMKVSAAARAADTAARAAACRKRARSKQSDMSRGAGFVIGVCSRVLESLSVDDRAEFCAQTRERELFRELFHSRPAAARRVEAGVARGIGKEAIIAKVDQADDARDAAAQVVAIDNHEVAANPADASVARAARDSAARAVVDSAARAADTKGKRADDSVARAASDSAARVADIDSAARADDIVYPKGKRACATWHRKPWHNGVLVHRFFIPDTASEEDMSIWQRCVCTFGGADWVQYVWTYSESDFLSVLGRHPPDNVVRTDASQILSRREVDELREFGASVQHVKDIFQMKVMSLYGGWFVDFDVVWLGGSALCVKSMERSVNLAERSASSKTQSSRCLNSAGPECILACQIEKKSGQWAKKFVLESEARPTSCYLGATWGRQGSHFARQAAAAMLQFWGAGAAPPLAKASSHITRRSGQAWNRHQDLVQTLVLQRKCVEHVAFAQADALCPLPRFLTSFANVQSTDDLSLYGVRISSLAHVARDSCMMTVWTGVWPTAISEAALAWAEEVAAVRGGQKSARCELRVDSLLPAVRTAACDLLESSLGLLRSCGFGSACSHEVLARALRYLEEERLCQALFDGAKGYCDVAGAGVAGAALEQFVHRLGVCMAAALLQASVKQATVADQDATGMCGASHVSLCLLRNAGAELCCDTSRDLVLRLDIIFIRAVGESCSSDGTS